MKDQPKVSVGVMTYNQAGYIRQALDSIIIQETEFPVRVVVHDDASNDGTQEIVESYASAYPDRIEAILQKENQLSQGRRIIEILLPYLTGTYLALLDGDDAWTNPRKLATQAKFLDSNPGCALCQTMTAYVDEQAGCKVESFPPLNRRRRRHDLTDLARSNFIQTSAVMIRSSALPTPLPAGFGSLPFGDYALFGLAARSGWVGLIDEEMALYRIHDKNFWKNRSQEEQDQKTRQVQAYIRENLPERDRRPWNEALGEFKPSAARRLVRRLRRMTKRPR